MRQSLHNKKFGPSQGQSGVETSMGPSRLGKGLDGDMEAQHA